jgi:hypothetical protein
MWEQSSEFLIEAVFNFLHNQNRVLGFDQGYYEDRNLKGRVHFFKFLLIL